MFKLGILILQLVRYNAVTEFSSDTFRILQE